jgi:hypothetical protein
MDNRTAIDAIEMAERATPFCICGQVTSAAGHDGNVWLECISFRDVQKTGNVARILRVLTEPAHVHELIIDNRQAA